MERLQYFLRTLFIITLCLGGFVAYEFFRLKYWHKDINIFKKI